METDVRSCIPLQLCEDFVTRHSEADTVKHQVTSIYKVNNGIGALNADILEYEILGITDPDQLLAFYVGIFYPEVTERRFRNTP